MIQQEKQYQYLNEQIQQTRKTLILGYNLFSKAESMRIIMKHQARLMMKVAFLAFSDTWDFLGDVHRVFLPINTTDINTQELEVRGQDSLLTKSHRQHRNYISWQMIIFSRGWLIDK